MLLEFNKKVAESMILQLSHSEVFALTESEGQEESFWNVFALAQLFCLSPHQWSKWQQSTYQGCGLLCSLLASNLCEQLPDIEHWDECWSEHSWDERQDDSWDECWGKRLGEHWGEHQSKCQGECQSERWGKCQLAHFI